MNLIRPGSSGEAVRDVQRRLLGLGHRIAARELAGVFGDSTGEAVRAFQASRGLPDDGIVGPDTWGRLVEAGWRLGDRTLYLRSPNVRGDDVLELQQRLNEMGFDVGKEDGIFGPRTHAAALEFQRNIGSDPDGIVGLGTVRALERLRPAVPGPSRAVVREEADLREAAAGPAGATVVLDASTDVGDEGGETGDGGAGEALTAVVGDAVRAIGARPLRLAGDDGTPTERSRRANDAGGAVYVAIRVRPGGDGAAGVAHWGTPSTHSPAGRLLAGFLAEELAAAGHAAVEPRPLAVSVLRETRMPAVIVDVSSGGDARAIADAIARAIGRFLGREAEPAANG